MPTSTVRATALVTLLLAAACTDPTLEPSADAPGATVPEALEGVPATAPRNVVAIEIGGQLRTGVLLDHRRALFDASLIATATVGSSLTVTYNPRGLIQTRTGRHLDRHPSDPRLAIVQVDPPFVSAPTLILADPAAPASTNTAVCVAATSPTSALEAQGTWSYLPGNPVPVVVHAAVGRRFSEHDVGIPCFRGDGRLLGLLVSMAVDGPPPPFVDAAAGAPPSPPPPTSANAWVNPSYPARAWIANLGELARVRALRDAGSLQVEGPLSLATTTVTGAEMCFDVPGGSASPQTPINQYPCHGGKAQQFYLEWDLAFSSFRIYSNASGLCLDVASASTVSGAAIQQYGCTNQPNQRWRSSSSLGNSLGNFKLRADHATGLCASAWTGLTATTPGLAITDRTCVTTNDAHQRWHRIARTPS
jgi:hypothetical protein